MSIRVRARLGAAAGLLWIGDPPSIGLGPVPVTRSKTALAGHEPGRHGTQEPLPRFWDYGYRDMGKRIMARRYPKA